MKFATALQSSAIDEMEAKRQEILADDNEMDDIAVDVLDSSEFMPILRQALVKPELAATQL